MHDSDSGDPESFSPLWPKVVKKDGELLMTCKAYNGRVVTEWLSDALRRCHMDASDPRMPCAYLCVILGAIHYSIIPVHV